MFLSHACQRVHLRPLMMRYHVNHMKNCPKTPRLPPDSAILKAGTFATVFLMIPCLTRPAIKYQLDRITFTHARWRGCAGNHGCRIREVRIYIYMQMIIFLAFSRDPALNRFTCQFPSDLAIVVVCPTSNHSPSKNLTFSTF